MFKNSNRCAVIRFKLQMKIAILRCLLSFSTYHCTKHIKEIVCLIVIRQYFVA